MNPGLTAFCGRWISALCNGGAQGLLLAAALWVVFKLARRANAATRHAVGLAGLAMMAALPAANFVWTGADSTTPANSGAAAQDPSGPLVAGALGAGKRPTIVLGNSGSASARAAVPSAGLDSAALSRADGGETDDWRLASERQFAAPPAWKQPAAETAAQNSGSSARLSIFRAGGDSVRRALAIADAGFERLAGRARRLAADFPVVWRISLPSGAALVLTALWMILALVRIGHLAWQCGQLFALKLGSAPAPAGWQALFQRLCAGSAASRRQPRLALNPRLGAPLAVGFLRPAILIPTAIMRNAGERQLEQVFRHELAHVARRDDWANLLQKIVKAALFFHPGVWWLDRRVTMDREIACDDHVLAAIDAPQEYALLLTHFASRALGRGFAAAPAAWKNKTQLKERIDMILDADRNASPRLAPVRAGAATIAAAALALLGLQNAPRLALAQESSGKTKTAAADPASTTHAASGLTRFKSTSAAISAARSGSAAPQASAASTAAPTPDELSSDESGPRSKPPLAGSEALLAAPAPIPGPSASVAIVVGPPKPNQPAALMAPGGGAAVASVGPAPLKPGQTALLPQPPGSDTRDSSDQSIERRLERLERMMKRLMARENQKGVWMSGQNDLAPDVGSPNVPLFKFGAMNEFKKGMPSTALAAQADLQDNLTRVEEQLQRAEKQAKQAQEEAQRASDEKAAREFDRAARELQQAAREFELKLKMSMAPEWQGGPPPGADKQIPSEKWAYKWKFETRADGQSLAIRRKILESERAQLEKRLAIIKEELSRIGREDEGSGDPNRLPNKKSWPSQPQPAPEKFWPNQPQPPKALPSRDDPFSN